MIGKATIRSIALLLVLGTLATPGLPGVQDILGKWAAKAETPNGPLELEMEIKMEGNTLVGSMAGLQGTIPLSNLKFEDPDLSLELSFGGSTFKLTGLLKDGKFSGKWEQVGSDMQGTWTAERKEALAPTSAPGILTGSWTSVSVTPNGDLTLVLDMKQEGDKVTGTLGSDMGTIPIQAASFKDAKLQFDVDYGGNTYRVEGTLKDDKFTGQWSAVGGTDSGAWSSTRRSQSKAAASATSSSAVIDGTWNSVAVTPDGNLPFQVSLTQSGETVSGNVIAPEGSIPIKNAKFSNNVLVFEVDYAGATYRIEATLAEGKLAGKWAAVSGPDTGAWSAERRTP